MRIIFNAYNLILGGGLTVGKGITEALLKLDIEDEIHLLLPQRKEYEFTSKRNIKIHYIPRFFTDYFLGRFFAFFYLSIKARSIKPDAVLSLGNYALKVNCAQLVLLQWPYAVYPSKSIWSRMGWWDYIQRKLRLLFLKRTLKYASALTVQTEVMKERVKKYIPSFQGPIHVVQSSFEKKSSELQLKELKKSPDQKFLLCMSLYYPHKNLEVLIQVAELIKQRKLPYKIVLTINKKNSKEPELLQNISNKKLDEIIINVGRIDHKYASSIYNKCDGLLLPTLIESYGIPYLEAAFAKLPIFTSNLDFAHAINGDTAWYFDPFSPEDIINTIQQAFSDEKLLNEKIGIGFERASNVESWESITRKYIEILKNL